MTDPAQDKPIRIPGIDKPISRFGFGCSKMTWPVKAYEESLNLSPDELGERAIRAALDLGINLFDHADVYKDGEVESHFGRILQKEPSLREKIVLQTKCGIVRGVEEFTYYDLSEAHIVASVEASLKRLNTDHVDILLFHKPDLLMEPEETAAACAKLNAQGKVSAFGVSNCSCQFIALLNRYMEQPIVVNQIQLSLFNPMLFDEVFLFNRTVPVEYASGLGTLEYCRLNDILIQSWAPVGRVMQAFDLDIEAFKPLARVMERMAKEKGAPVEAIASAWLLRYPGTIQPLLGSRMPERLEACWQGLQIELTRAEWYELYLAARNEPVFKQERNVLKEARERLAARD